MSIRNERSKHGARKPGVATDAPSGVIEFFTDFLSSLEYRHNVKSRILAGEAHHMEILGHQYAFGNPSNRVVVDPPPLERPSESILKHMSDEDLNTFCELTKKRQELWEKAVEAETRQSGPRNGMP